MAAVARDEAFGGEVRSEEAREREERWGLDDDDAAAVDDDDDDCVIWEAVLSFLSRRLMSPTSSWANSEINLQDDASYDASYTSHVTRHTSHITHHTSSQQEHDTPLTSARCPPPPVKKPLKNSTEQQKTQ